jgi:hypothetical protein
MDKKFVSMDISLYNKSTYAGEAEFGIIYRISKFGLMMRCLNETNGDYIPFVNLFIKGEIIDVGPTVTCFAQDDPLPELPEGMKRVKDLVHGDIFSYNTSAVGLKNGYVHICSVLGGERHYREMIGSSHKLSELDPNKEVYLVEASYTLQGDAE